MKKQITIATEKGKFYLIGEDGYTTTDRKYKTREEAEKAKNREQKLFESGKESRMKWNY